MWFCSFCIEKCRVGAAYFEEWVVYLLWLMSPKYSLQGHKMSAQGIRPGYSLHGSVTPYRGKSTILQFFCPFGARFVGRIYIPRAYALGWCLIGLTGHIWRTPIKIIPVIHIRFLLKRLSALRTGRTLLLLSRKSKGGLSQHDTWCWLHGHDVAIAWSWCCNCNIMTMQATPYVIF